MRRALSALLAVAGLLLAAPTASASEQHPTLKELETQIICPTCQTTLDQSDAPIAQRLRAFIARRIAAGASKSQIEDELVAQFGPSILANPPKRGWGLVAWLLPVGGAVVAAGALALAARHWRRPPAPAAALDPELERRLDDELARFDDR
ncbi:MAG: cytochrome c-type biogenesis protein [Gaiellaceae bacterium]